MTGVRAYLAACGFIVGLVLYCCAIGFTANAVENSTHSTGLGFLALIGCIFLTGLAVAIFLDLRDKKGKK